jgi:hypothetical protein
MTLDFSIRDPEDALDMTAPEIVSIRGTLTELIADLDGQGWRMLASGGGHWCGFDVYRAARSALPGVTPPDDWRCLSRVLPGTPQVPVFLAALKATCERLRSLAPDGVKPVWRQVALDFLDKARDVRSTSYQISRSMIGPDPRTLTLTGEALQHRWIPPVEWFPEALREYDPLDLLTLFPPAERDMMALFLGRLVAGGRGYRTEGYLDHTWRSYVLVVGTTAGMGKSTLMGYINRALEAMGYSTALLDTTLNQFSWANSVSSDLVQVDDLVADVQTGVLQSASLKSFVSNSPMHVQAKGVQGWDVIPTGVFLGLTNGYRHSDYYSMDPGSLARTNQLYTWDKAELAEAYPGVADARIKPYWEAKAKEYGVPTDTLAAYLLRRCLDRFLAVIGYQLIGPDLVRVAPDTLEETLGNLREQYRIAALPTHAYELLEASHEALAWSLALMGQRRWEKHYGAISFGPTVLRISLGLMTCGLGPKGLQPASLSPESLIHYQVKSATWERAKEQQSVSKMFETLIGELVSDRGHCYPKHMGFYQDQWKDLMRGLPRRIQELQDTLPDGEPPSGVSWVSQLLQTFFSNVKAAQ